jgi:hypothetical protein
MPDYANDILVYWKVKDIIPHIPDVVQRIER